MIELKQNKWNQVVIPHSNALSGKGMQDLINLMMEVKKFKYVVLDDMQGIAQEYLMHIFQNQQHIVMRLKDLLPILQDVEWFEWGCFYLLEEYNENWDNEGHYFDFYMVKKTDSTIRAMDGNYAYIYTPYDSVAEIVTKNYTTEEIKTDFLENLDYPG